MPLGRRLLVDRPRRLVLSLVGVGLALMLVLVLDGISAGVDQRVTVFEDQVGADLYVAQPGTGGFLGGTSLVPAATEAAVAATPGVAWTAPVRAAFSVPHGRRGTGAELPRRVRARPAGRPVEASPTAGRRLPTPRSPSGTSCLARTGVGVGDEVDLFGHPMTVVGIAGDADMVLASFVFMTHAAAETVLGSPDTTSFVLVGADDPAAVAASLDACGPATSCRRHHPSQRPGHEGPGLHGGRRPAGGHRLRRRDDRHRPRRVQRHHRAPPRVRHRQGDGSVAALLVRLVLGQAVALAVGGLVAAGVLFLVTRALLGALRPAFAVVVDAGSIGRLGVAALAMALVAAILPARRLDAMDPALAFRGG
ncbi:MAG: ABC transporter permease [Acidimicrobiales bacterium]